MSRLDEIKARADAATEGPWHWREGEPTSLVHVTSPGMHPWNILKAPDWGPILADAEFIAAAREDVPWLVAQVDRLEAWRAEALGIIDYRGEQQRRAEDERDNALAEVTRLTAERDALAAQVERLERWKAEALEVMSGLRELGKALGLGPGVQITGPAALAEVARLTAERDALIAVGKRQAARLARVEADVIAAVEQAEREHRDTGVREADQLNGGSK